MVCEGEHTWGIVMLKNNHVQGRKRYHTAHVRKAPPLPLPSPLNLLSHIILKIIQPLIQKSLVISSTQPPLPPPHSQSLQFIRGRFVHSRTPQSLQTVQIHPPPPLPAMGQFAE